MSISRRPRAVKCRLRGSGSAAERKTAPVSRNRSRPGTISVRASSKPSRFCAYSKSPPTASVADVRITVGMRLEQPRLQGFRNVDRSRLQITSAAPAPPSSTQNAGRRSPSRIRERSGSALARRSSGIVSSGLRSSSSCELARSSATSEFTIMIVRGRSRNDVVVRESAACPRRKQAEKLRCAISQIDRRRGRVRPWRTSYAGRQRRYRLLSSCHLADC